MIDCNIKSYQSALQFLLWREKESCQTLFNNNKNIYLVQYSMYINIVYVLVLISGIMELIFALCVNVQYPGYTKETKNIIHGKAVQILL